MLPREEDKVISTCSKCKEDIHQYEINGGRVTDNYVYKLGALAYIELFHLNCEA